MAAANLKSIGAGLELYAQAYDNRAIPNNMNCYMDGTESYTLRIVGAVVQLHCRRR